MIKKGILFGAFFCICIFAHAQFLVKDIAPGQRSSEVNYLTDVNGIVYFTANDSIHGFELWRSDGTTQGTYMVEDLYPGKESAGAYPMWSWGDTSFWLMNHPISKYSICRTLGIAGSTVPIHNLRYNPKISTGNLKCVVMGHIAVFSYFDTATGNELWRSDGTDTGTWLIKDIKPGKSSSSPTSLFVNNEKVYFIADDSISGAGKEIWVSDGTASGTRSLRDINPYYIFAAKPEFTVFKNELYFIALDQMGWEIWKTNGTFTTKVTNMADIGGSVVSDLTVYKNKIYFFGSDPNFGTELWECNGTASGTYLVRNVDPSANSSFPYDLTVHKDKLYFSANNGNKGSEIWISDGTMLGTSLLKDIVPGAGSSYPSGYISTPGDLYFTAYIPGSGFWKTDGTSAGTKQVEPTMPGVDSLYCSEFKLSGDYLYMAAGKNSPFRELYAIYVKDTALKDSTASVHKMENKAFELFPNPTTGIVKINAPEINAMKIAVYDVSGRMILETDKKEIDVSACAKGIYFIQVNNICKKLIVE